MKEVEQQKDSGKSKESNIKKKLILFLLSFLVILALFFLDVRKAEPDNQPFYNIKRLYEKIQLNSKSDPKDKLNYLYQLLDERLSELIFIVQGGKSSYVLTTSLRYSTTAGEITELILNNNLKDESQNAKQKFEEQLLIIKGLPPKYPRDDEEIKYVVDDANYLKIYIDKLSSL